MKIQRKNIKYLIFQLIWRTENMGVVLGKTTHAQQAVECASAFIPIHRSQLAPPDGQFAVTALSTLVNTNMKRTVHRFQLIFDLINIHC